MFDCNCLMNVAILNDGIVENLVVAKDINEVLQIAIQLYGIEHGDAKDTYGWNVAIGDRFKDFIWYKPDGTECERIPTGEERVFELEVFKRRYTDIINMFIFPPLKYTKDDIVPECIARQLIDDPTRSITEVAEDRGLRQAVQEIIEGWNAE